MGQQLETKPLADIFSYHGVEDLLAFPSLLGQSRPTFSGAYFAVGF